VVLWDMTEELLGKAKSNMAKSLERVAAKKFEGNKAGATAFQEETLARVTTTTKQEAAAERADLVLEAVVENLSIKQQLFARLDRVCQPSTIFASNTSSLPIGAICNGVRSARFGGLHFFNPVPVMRLVEVVRTSETSDETHAALVAFGTAVGKTPVNCKDTPGFIVNRLLVPYMVDAVRMHERGDASTRDIDVSMKLGCGYPMGPFELADYVGLDTIKFILEGWHQRYPDEPQFKPSAAIDKLVKQGRLGVKSGAGFYEYPAKTKQ
jgi:3-hydroxyacyl-CoA dehydrogenase